MQPDSLGKKIRRLRINNCLSQARLAEVIDVSTNYIGQIERGDRTPSLETTIALCNALHASVDYVVSDDISTRDDEIMTDIRAQLVKLTPDEKQYFYHMIVGYIQLKGENAATEKIAVNYSKAVDNSKKTVKALLPDGLPELEDTDIRNQWLNTKSVTFSNVYEAIEFLQNLG